MGDFTIFIGYDQREAVAWHVCAHSLMRRASKPVRISPLIKNQLRSIHERDDPRASTDFSLTRFLTPHLARDGVSMFVDCDFLFLGDVWELYERAKADPYSDVFCVKHDYIPKPDPKFLGAAQYAYPKKNWSSLMLFNGHRAAVKRLTPDYVQRASPSDLHQMAWAQSIGSLPKSWNWLVGEYEPVDSSALKALHFTRQTPCFGPSEYEAEWWNEYHHMTHADMQPSSQKLKGSPAWQSATTPA
jgi:hypothetical protein